MMRFFEFVKALSEREREADAPRPIQKRPEQEEGR